MEPCGVALHLTVKWAVSMVLVLKVGHFGSCLHNFKQLKLDSVKAATFLHS